MTWDIKKILVPTDGSESAGLALEPAIDLASHKNAEIVTISVTAAPFDFSCYSASGAAQGAQIIEDLKNDIAKANVDKVANEMQKAGLKDTSIVVSGSPADEIIKAAVKENIDLIVMGTKGAADTRRILGSAAASVISNAPCPVLTVREKGRGIPFVERARRM